MLRRPLRVMFIITSMHVGGAETLLLNLLRRIDRSRFSPELCCLKELGELGQQLQREIPVHDKLLRNKFDIRVLWRLTKLLRKRQIDAVITVGAGDKMFWGRLAARRAGMPVVISALHSTGWPDCITWLNRRLNPLTDAFVAVADRHAKYLVEHEHLPSDRVVVISNGVDTDQFRRTHPIADLRQQLGIPHSAPLVGIVAVLRPEKNHEMFLRVAARVRRDVVEAQFLIIGDGPRRSELELLAMQLGLSDCVHFLGKRTDVAELLGLLDVFLLTSHMEANPVSILEALASGKPVVSTAVGSIPQTVIDGVTGYLVEPNDELTMARRVSELLLDPAKSQHLGAAGRRLVIENWSLERMVAGYEDLIERLYREKTLVHCRTASELRSGIHLG
jgi:glycosyltransferase involved in cell wall biosynthesis